MMSDKWSVMSTSSNSQVWLIRDAASRAKRLQKSIINTLFKILMISSTFISTRDIMSSFRYCQISKIWKNSWRKSLLANIQAWRISQNIHHSITRESQLSCFFVNQMMIKNTTVSQSAKRSLGNSKTMRAVCKYCMMMVRKWLPNQIRAKSYVFVTLYTIFHKWALCQSLGANANLKWMLSAQETTLCGRHPNFYILRSLKQLTKLKILFKKMDT